MAEGQKTQRTITSNDDRARLDTGADEEGKLRIQRLKLRIIVLDESAKMNA
jgi:hypothetical protein